jgi:hypothetical protein
MRSRVVLSLILALLAGAGCYVAWKFGRRNGLAMAMVVLSPLIGVALAPLFGPLLSHAVQTARIIAYREIEGRHFEYKGRPLTVREDLEGDRWIRTDDIRCIVLNLPRDEVLARRAPAGIGCMDGQKGVFFLAQELSSYLDRSHDEGTIRFRNWLQREVISPAERAKQILSRQE